MTKAVNILLSILVKSNFDDCHFFFVKIVVDVLLSEMRDP